MMLLGVEAPVRASGVTVKQDGCPLPLRKRRRGVKWTALAGRILPKGGRFMDALTVLGSLCSIIGLVLMVYWHMTSKKNEK